MKFEDTWRLFILYFLGKSIGRKYLKIASKAIERLNLIVKDLDFITKLETGDSNIKKSNFDIVDLINNSIEMLEISANKKNIKLEIIRPSRGN